MRMSSAESPPAASRCAVSGAESDRSQVEDTCDLLGCLRAGAEMWMKARRQAQTCRQVDNTIEPVCQQRIIRVAGSVCADRAAANHEVGGAKLGGKLGGAANLVQLLTQDLGKDEVGTVVDPDKL